MLGHCKTRAKKNERIMQNSIFICYHKLATSRAVLCFHSVLLKMQTKILLQCRLQLLVGKKEKNVLMTISGTKQRERERLKEKV